MLSRRAILALPAAVAACSRRHKTTGYRGYAFIANQEGEGLVAVDLELMAVERHIPLGAAPNQVVAALGKPVVYALTPDTGSIHEIQVYRLNDARKVTVASSAVSICLSPDEKSLYVLAREPRALISVALDSFRTEWQLPLPDEPVEFAVATEGKRAAITTGQGVWIVDLAARRLTGPLREGDFGAVQFRQDGKVMFAANRGERLLSLFDAPSGRLLTHLPVSLRPDNLCSSRDGGQLFVTGDGMDAVVIVYPYHSFEIAETVLAGRAPGAMATSNSLLFVASPQSGAVSILNIATYQVIAVTQVGTDPGFVIITPDDQYALVLNRKSGDLAVLGVAAIARNRYKSASLLTVIPVGSRPVSAAVRGV
jgi:YVTN family beta-propeller protein